MKEPCCGPYAVAILTGASLSEAMEHVRRIGRHGPRWKGRSTIRELEYAITRMGCLPVRRDDLAKGTVKTWVERNAHRSGRYLLRTGDHFVAVIGWDVSDQHHTRPAAEHWTRKKRVTHVFEVKGSK